jgi:hypothetical protein
MVAVELDRHHRRIARQQRRCLGVIQPPGTWKAAAGGRLAGGGRPEAGFDAST